MKYPEIFEYVWYRSYLFYTSNKDNIPKYSAVLLLTLVQMCNFLTIDYLFEYMINTKFVNKGIIIVFGIILVGLTISYFNKNKCKAIIAKWENEPVKQKKTRGVFVALYVLLSFFIVTGVAIYIGFKHKQ